MELFFMRHAEAERHERYPEGHQRPLTEQGRQTQSLVARALVSVLQPLHYLLSSPLLRARQTADIVAAALPFAGQVEETAILGADCTAGAVLRLLQGYPCDTRILCVGHEPNMSRLSAIFLDGGGHSAIAFQPGAIIGLAFQRYPEPGRGTLRFFLRPTDLLPMVARLGD